MEQIKEGDIVRVSEDAPEMYKGKGFYALLTVLKSKVLEIVDGNALVQPDYTNDSASQFAIPVKYLIKVNAEPKEQTIKVGDKVSVIMAYKPETKPLLNSVGEVLDIADNGDCYVLFRDTQAWVHKDNLVLYSESKKQLTREIAEGWSDALLNASKNVGTICDIANEFYWQQYASDLAKEIAVKITNNKMDNAPCEVGEYAVLIAKSVVENLKKSEK